MAPGEDPLPRAMFALVSARTRRARGDLAGARQALDEATSGAVALPAWLRDRLRVEGATLDVVDGEPARALRAVAALADSGSAEAALVTRRARLATAADVADLPPITKEATLAARVDLWLVEASRRLGQGEEQAAHHALERSLRLAAPETLRRPFYEAPADIRQLLRSSGDLAAQHAWLGRGTATRPPAPAPAAPAWDEARPGPRPLEGGLEGADGPVPEPLTPKELEVLGHLADLLTTEEIAGAMFVSVNTVRTHVRNILRKLTVSRRNEAVRKARALRIIA